MEHFSKWRQLVYANGHLGFSIMDNIYGAYLVFFLIPPKELGMPELMSNNPLFLGLTVIGLINIFGRIIDSLADPFIAWWSDNAKYKIGRRKFFILTGALPFAAAGVALFFQPEASISSVNALYTAVVLGVYFFFYTYYMSPNLALIPELSRTPDERIQITVFQAIFSLAGAIAVLIVAPMIWSGLQGSGMEITRSFQLTMIILSAFAAVSMFVAGLSVDEKRFSSSKPADIGLVKSVKMTLKNRWFIRYMIGTILYWFGFNMLRAVIAYYPIVLLHKDSGFQMILMASLFGVAFIVFFFLPFLSKRFTHKQLMLAGMLSFSLLFSFTYVILWLGPAAVPVAVIQMALMGFPVSILLVIPNAAVSDLSELDGYKTGLNREAMFFGTQGLFMKVNYGIALAITASLFSFFGKDASAPLGVALTGPVGSLFLLAGFFIFLKYPQEEITRELEEYRKGQ